MSLSVKARGSRSATLLKFRLYFFVCATRPRADLQYSADMNIKKSAKDKTPYKNKSASIIHKPKYVCSALTTFDQL